MFSFEGKRMSALTVVGGLLALGLLAYLVAALLFPEDFS
jgi:K+-transporting ATPase, KdpF subunit